MVERLVYYFYIRLIIRQESSHFCLPFPATKYVFVTIELLEAIKDIDLFHFILDSKYSWTRNDSG